MAVRKLVSSVSKNIVDKIGKSEVGAMLCVLLFIVPG